MTDFSLIGILQGLSRLLTDIKRGKVINHKAVHENMTLHSEKKTKTAPQRQHFPQNKPLCGTMFGSFFLNRAIFLKKKGWKQCLFLWRKTWLLFAKEGLFSKKAPLRCFLSNIIYNMYKKKERVSIMVLSALKDYTHTMFLFMDRDPLLYPLWCRSFIMFIIFHHIFTT